MSKHFHLIVAFLRRPLGRIALCATVSPSGCLFGSSGGGPPEPLRDWCLPEDTDRVIIHDAATTNTACLVRVVAAWPDGTAPRELECSPWGSNRCGCAVTGNDWNKIGVVPSHLLVTDSATGAVLHDGPALYDATCRASAVAQRRTP